MRIILAGYNVDSTVLEELKAQSPPRADVTPETLSASYARISRDPRSVEKLRAVARAEVEKARRSNRNIIFKMGHHSVAEHAVFNFDVIGISRLAIEEIEKFRLCSYTEKSQRYIKLEDDHIIPAEIAQAGLSREFGGLIEAQNSLYNVLYSRLRPYFFDKHPALAADSRKHSLLNGWAMEDARYVLSLATLGQLGMTLNARSLEHMIRRLASHPLAEVREFNRQVYELAKDVAPSILLFTEANEYDALTYGELRRMADELLPSEAPEITEAAGHADKESSAEAGSGSVRLAGHTPDPDTTLIAALLHSTSDRDYASCREAAQRMTPDQRTEMIKAALGRMEFFDAVLREFEHVDLTFELVVSATCFAQLKRHRMSTLTAQPYDPAKGVVVPPSIEAAGARPEFMAIIRETEAFFENHRERIGRSSEYALTNAHCKRVLWKTNARELYHFSRLREDATAQWDIRRVASEMSRRAAEEMPLTLLLIGGKDAFPDVYRRVFGRSPGMKPPSY
jgi:flavin-dependent thymidylate synthase